MFQIHPRNFIILGEKKIACFNLPNYVDCRPPAKAVKITLKTKIIVRVSCYVMLRYVMLPYFMLRYVIWCDAMRCDVM